MEIDALVTRLGSSFVGRESELQRLVALAGAREGAYLLLEAEGGVGKSALLVQLLLMHERGRWPGATPALLAFFVRDPGWRRPEEFLSSLNAQLLDLLRKAGGTPSDLLGLRTQFSELWGEAITRASATVPLLLVVDGLDEMLPGETTIADLLPSALGDYVHVIVSSRPRPSAAEAVPPGHPLRAAERMVLANFDVASVRALLQAMGAAAALAPLVHAMTRGEPLFARAVAEDLARDGDAVLAALESAPPAGAREYFVQQLRALDDAARDDAAWRLCELLAAAKGPMSMDELAAAAARGKRDVRRTLEPIERFLVGGERVQFFHRRLYEAIHAEMGASATRGGAPTRRLVPGRAGRALARRREPLRAGALRRTPGRRA